MRGVRRECPAARPADRESFGPESEQRFAGFRVPEDYEAVFESRAGYLLVEKCVLRMPTQAMTHGAEVHTGESVVRWQADESGVVVRDRPRRVFRGPPGCRGGTLVRGAIGRVGYAAGSAT